MVHAQDHLMNAMTVKDLAAELVDLYQRLAGAAGALYALYLLASELRLAQVAQADGDHENALEHARAALEHARASGALAGIGAAEAALQRLQVATG